ncbi:MAG: hypothetical protein JWO32_2350 [Bacteroidetes bacterium]|nr:hypothetical protein [Bacteroidota bacterium]
MRDTLKEGEITVKISFILIVILLMVSCSGDNHNTHKVIVKKDTVKSEYLKNASRDSKNYVNDCKVLFAEAKRMDSIIMHEMEVKTDIANSAIKAFTDYSFYCKNDSISPVFLIKSAQIAQSVNNIPQAKFVLDKCINDYPHFKNLPAALFLLGQLYDDENSYLNNETEAQKLYKRIIDEYPKSDLAPSAKGALMMIGKSDKQMMEEFKKKK